MLLSVPKRKNENKHGHQALYNEVALFFQGTKNKLLPTTFNYFFSNSSLVKEKKTERKKNKQWDFKVFPAE